ncbi:hypothetical protein QYF36_027299 [Acer negundo]|nr:hypothetical protein QYF36_027299 [Acer negundo]
MRGFHLAFLVLLVVIISSSCSATTNISSCVGDVDDAYCSGWLIESQLNFIDFKLQTGDPNKPAVDCGRGSGSNYRSCLGVSHGTKIGENCFDKNHPLYPPANKNC